MVFWRWLVRAVLMQSGNSITRDLDKLNWVKWSIIIIINGGILSPDRFPPLSSRTKTHHGGNLSWWEYAGRPKIRSFGPPAAKLWPNIFQYISIYFSTDWRALDDHKVHQKQKLFREGFASDCVWPSLGMVGNAGTPRKNVSLRKCTFRGLRLSLCHFGRQVPESPVSQLQNGVSTSSLPNWHLKFTQGPTHFFNGNFRGHWMADFTSGLQWA